MTDQKNGPNLEDRRPDGTFKPGAGGRKKGSRNKTTLAIEELLDGQAEAITQKAVDMALAGDATALRLCIERIAPARKDTAVSFDLPKIQSAHEASEAAAAVLTAVSNGELTPVEGASVMGLVESYRRVLETSEFEARIAALEARK